MPNPIKSLIKKNRFLYILTRKLLYLKRAGLVYIFKNNSKRKKTVKKLNYQLKKILQEDYFNSFFQKDSIKICIQVHLFNLELINEIIQNLNQIPFLYDCYITTDTDEKASIIQKEFSLKCANAQKITIEKTDNRGRDIAPFLLQMKKYLVNYEYLLHIHTKKSQTHIKFRDRWRRYLYKHLLGSTKNIYRIFCNFLNNQNIGIIFPFTYYELFPVKWGVNIEQGKNNVSSFLERIGIKTDLPNIPEFPAGNMFWARTKAIQKVFQANLTQADFPQEGGQLDLTLAHAIERSWVYAAQSEGYTYEEI